MAKQHYEHACEKHPWFCEDICEKTSSWARRAEDCKVYLMDCSEKHDKGQETDCYSFDIIAAELAEIYAAYAAGDYDEAIQEIYDAIAILLRMEDMILEKKEDSHA